MVFTGEIFNAVKKAGQAVTNSDVPVNATDLVLQYLANGSRPFYYRFYIPFVTGLTGGYRFFVDVTGASATTQCFSVFDGGTGLVVNAGMFNGSTSDITGAITGPNSYCIIEGVILDGTGTLQLQFAQNTPDATPIDIQAPALASGYYV